MKTLALAGILCLLVLVNAATLPPDKPVPKKELPIPKIAGSSVWGTIAQINRKITIDGDAQWFVKDGEIKKDGSLFLIWIFRDDGRAAPGVYTINKDGGITGHWNWGEYVTENADGSFSGITRPDILRVAPR